MEREPEGEEAGWPGLGCPKPCHPSPPGLSGDTEEAGRQTVEAPSAASLADKQVNPPLSSNWACLIAIRSSDSISRRIFIREGVG